MLLLHFVLLNWLKVVYGAFGQSNMHASYTQFLHTLARKDNLQYNTLGHWVDHLIDQASDSPSSILID